MSESKYQPPVNIPENIPGHATNPSSLIVQFLHASGQWVGASADQLGLLSVKEEEKDMIALGYSVGKEFRELVRFPGKLVLEERRVVVP